MSTFPVHDTPWRRPGAVRYALTRIRSIVRPQISVLQAPAGLRKQQDVPVLMPDGVTLRVNIYLPADAGPFPVLMCAHPYGKDKLPRRTWRGWKVSAQYRILRQTSPVAISSETGWEAPDPVWWTAHGYAVVNCDVRGSGRSEGVGAVMSDQEADDVSRVIAWAAGQPWCTGDVGMLGVSYLAIVQYKVAALHPPQLKAICPWEGFTDAYRDLMSPGGITESGFSRIWQVAMKRNMRTTLDLAAQRAAHPLRDDWWQTLVPALARIEVPMLVCASFSDNDLHSRGSFRAFDKASSVAKYAYTHRGGKWATFYSPDALAAQLAFFDRHLKGIDGPEIPAIRLEVRRSLREISEIRTEQEWPLARTQWRDLYLSDSGMLSRSASPGSGSVTFHTRKQAAAFTYQIDEDLELTGPMSLDLWVSVSGASDVSLFLGVEKWDGTHAQPFEGSYGFGRERVATGWQRAALRELDPDVSTLYQPVHTFDRPQPLAPAEIVPVRVALGPSATRFHRGDQLRLLVAGRQLASRNPLTGSFPGHWTPSQRAMCTLHWGPMMPALLRTPHIAAPLLP